MTEEQVERFRKLSEEHNLTVDDYDDLTLLMIGIDYELSDEQLSEIIETKANVTEKHLLLLCRILKINYQMNGEADDSDKDNKDQTKEQPPKQKTEDDCLKKVDVLDHILRLHYQPKEKKKENYDYLSELLLDSKELSAAQIEQIKKAVKVKMPEKNILAMIRSGKKPIEMEKTIEFYLMVDEKNKEIKTEPVTEKKKWFGRK